MATDKRHENIIYLLATRPMPDGSLPQPGGWNRFVIEVIDIETLCSTMKQDGIVFRNEIISGPGGKQILVEDPSGNPIELFQPVWFPKTKKRPTKVGRFFV